MKQERSFISPNRAPEEPDPDCPKMQPVPRMYAGHTLPDLVYLWCLQSPRLLLRQKENLVWSSAEYGSEMEARVA